MKDDSGAPTGSGRGPSYVGDEESRFNLTVLMGRSALVHLVGMAVSGVLGIAVTVGLSRRLGFDDLGLYVLGFGGLVLVATVTGTGLNTAALHFAANHKARGQHRRADAYAWWAVVLAGGLGTVGAVGFWALSPTVASLLGEPRLTPVLAAMAWGIPLYSVMHVSAGALRGARAIAPAILAPHVLYPVVNFTAIAGVLLFVPDLMLVVYGTLFALAVSAGTGLLFLLREFPRKLSTVPLQGFIKYGAGNVMVQVMNYGVLWIGVYVLGFFLASSEVGFFRAAGHTAIMLTLVLEGLGSLYAPLSSGLFARADLDRLDEVTKSVARIAFFVTALISIPAVLAPETVLAPFGQNIGPAVPAFAVLALAHTVAAVIGPASWTLVTGERLDLAIMAKGPAIAASAGLCWALIPPFGIMGAAVATATAIVVRLAVHYMLVQDVFGLQPLTRPLGFGVGLYGVLMLSGLAVKSLLPLSGYIAATVTLVVFLWIGFHHALTAGDRRVLEGIVHFIFNPTTTPISRPEKLFAADLETSDRSPP